MTNPFGRSFLSYRRSHLGAAKLLIEAQHEIGIPTWQDVEDLENGPLEDELRRQLEDPDTANAVWYMTPDVADSSVIRNIEYPMSIRRQRRRDAFFVKPIAAAGLDYAAAAALLPDSTIEDLSSWNVSRITGDLKPPDAAGVARSVLEHRIRRIHAHLKVDDPIRLGVYTRCRAPENDGLALAFDWTHLFAGRTLDADGWSRCAAAAYRGVAVLRRLTGKRRLEITGSASLAASVLLGTLLMEPTGISCSWLQHTRGTSCPWSLQATPQYGGFDVSVRAGSSSGTDIAVMASLNRSVEPTVAKSVSVSQFRVTVEAKWNDASPMLTPGQGTGVARELMRQVRRARDEYDAVGNLHLFLAVPASVAFMIGQQLNTFGRVQTYEHIAESDIYQPAILLSPSGTEMSTRG